MPEAVIDDPYLIVRDQEQYLHKNPDTYTEPVNEDPYLMVRDQELYLNRNPETALGDEAENTPPSEDAREEMPAEPEDSFSTPSVPLLPEERQATSQEGNVSLTETSSPAMTTPPFGHPALYENYMFSTPHSPRNDGYRRNEFDFEEPSPHREDILRQGEYLYRYPEENEEFFMPDYLKGYIGKHIKADCLIGNYHEPKSGYLKKVGRNYIVLETDADSEIVCEIPYIKSVTAKRSNE